MLIRHPASRTLIVIVPDTDFISCVLLLVFVDQEVDVVDVEPDIMLRALVDFKVQILLIKLLLSVLADEANRLDLFL